MSAKSARFEDEQPRGRLIGNPEEVIKRRIARLREQSMSSSVQSSWAVSKKPAALLRTNSEPTLPLWDVAPDLGAIMKEWEENVLFWYHEKQRDASIRSSGNSSYDSLRGSGDLLARNRITPRTDSVRKKVLRNRRLCLVCQKPVHSVAEPSSQAASSSHSSALNAPPPASPSRHPYRPWNPTAQPKEQSRECGQCYKNRTTNALREWRASLDASVFSTDMLERLFSKKQRMRERLRLSLNSAHQATIPKQARSDQIRKIRYMAPMMASRSKAPSTLIADNYDIREGYVLFGQQPSPEIAQSLSSSPSTLAPIFSMAYAQNVRYLLFGLFELLTSAPSGSHQYEHTRGELAGLAASHKLFVSSEELMHQLILLLETDGDGGRQVSRSAVVEFLIIWLSVFNHPHFLRLRFERYSGSDFQMKTDRTPLFELMQRELFPKLTSLHRDLLLQFVAEQHRVVDSAARAISASLVDDPNDFLDDITTADELLVAHTHPTGVASTPFQRAVESLRAFRNEIDPAATPAATTSKAAKAAKLTPKGGTLGRFARTSSFRFLAHDLIGSSRSSSSSAALPGTADHCSVPLLPGMLDARLPAVCKRKKGGWRPCESLFLGVEPTLLGKHLCWLDRHLFCRIPLATYLDQQAISRPHDDARIGGYLAWHAELTELFCWETLRVSKSKRRVEAVWNAWQVARYCWEENNWGSFFSVAQMVVQSDWCMAMNSELKTVKKWYHPVTRLKHKTPIMDAFMALLDAGQSGYLQRLNRLVPISVSLSSAASHNVCIVPALELVIRALTDLTARIKDRQLSDDMIVGGWIHVENYMSLGKLFFQMKKIKALPSYSDDYFFDAELHSLLINPQQHTQGYKQFVALKRAEREAKRR